MGGPCFVFLYEQIPARGALIALDLTRYAQVAAASSGLPAAFQKENTILTDGVSFWSGRRGSTRYRHPTNGRAIRRSPAGPLDLMRFAPVEAASSSLPAAFQKENTILTDGVSFWSGRRGSTRYRHPTNGRAIRRSPAGPLDLMRFAPVEAASSSLPAAFQKENTILTDGVSFWSGRRGSNSLPRPWQGRALPDELRPQTQGRL